MRKTHRPYTEEEKERVVVRLLSPAAETIKDVAADTGISIPTLKKWKKAAEENADQERDGTQEKTAEEIFQIVLATIKMDEYELGEYARTNGLYVQDIKNWQQNARLSNGVGACTLKKFRELEERVKVVSKENSDLRSEKTNMEKQISEKDKKIAEKDKVIAEQAAIISLQKKTFHLS